MGYVPRTVLRVITPPAVEPITVADAKTELGITAGDQDARLARLIRTARELAEQYTNRAFITQTLGLQLDAFPERGIPWWDGVRQVSIQAFTGGDPIWLPRPPAIAVTSVTYWDADDTEFTMDATQYEVDAMSEPARLVLLSGASWPFSVRAYRAGLVTYTAGYGSDPADLPGVIAEAILSHVRDSVERPNPAVTSENIDNVAVAYGGAAGATGAGLRGDAMSMLAPLRIMEAPA